MVIGSKCDIGCLNFYMKVFLGDSVDSYGVASIVLQAWWRRHGGAGIDSGY